MTYQEFRQGQARLWAAMDAAGARLKAIPGVGCGQMGLTPDWVKESAAYREARREFDCAMRALQRFNAANVKRFAKEAAADRRAQREALTR
jgi:hypothetical protein